MRWFPLLLAAVLAPVSAVAAPQSWVLATDLWGNPLYQTLVIEGDGGRIEGRLDRDPVTGTRSGKTIRFAVTTPGGARFSGHVDGDQVRGMADLPDTNDPRRRAPHAFTGRRIADRPAGGPRRIVFTPTSWSNLFSQHRAPVLTIWPGDTVRTQTLDSGGMDDLGVTRALYGNPQVGPFFIAGAESGDTLVIRIDSLAINRDFADSQDQIVGRALSNSLAAKAGDLGKRLKWRLDAKAGTARPEQTEGALKDYVVPVRPMLGGLAVAPAGGGAPISTGDTGRFGGNMDFNEVTAGAIIYLPVQQPGALLYLGDGHARQGDGETTQWALETSLDVEFTVDLLKGKAIQAPRVESATQIMVLGQAPSLDEAVRAATEGLVQWLERDYGLTISQSAQVLGVAARYSVVTLAGRNAGMAVRLDKDMLPPRR